MNRIDRTVVFQALGPAELHQILDIELQSVQARILQSCTAKSIMIDVTDAGREFLLKEGTDERYGARHLKRAIEQHLMHPMSNLMASGQVQAGDCVTIDVNGKFSGLNFSKYPREKTKAAGA